MIVVIADDLTGAAELAGVGWRHGLVSQVQRALVPDSDAELLAVNADTRLLSAASAARRIAVLAEACRQRGVSSVFKKVDSVLRGHVVAEMTALMDGLGRARGLLVPANPGLGRTVWGGRYLVHGIPLDQTEFARDPAYPVRSAEVSDILGPSTVFPVTSTRLGEGLPEHGIAVGDARRLRDMDKWAEALDESIVPAGAAEFFGGYLRACGYRSGVSPRAGRLP